MSQWRAVYRDMLRAEPAELTFYVPDETAEEALRQARTMEHDSWVLQELEPALPPELAELGFGVATPESTHEQQIDDLIEHQELERSRHG